MGKNRIRLTLGLAASFAVAATVTGCAATSPADTTTTPRASASAVVAPSPSETPSATPAPTVAPSRTPATSEPTGGSSVSALAQHVYDACNTGADDAGVVLEFTADPSGYTSDGKYMLIYPMHFADGHIDPWAIYNCTLSDDTVDSTFLGGGVTDMH